MTNRDHYRTEAMMIMAAEFKRQKAEKLVERFERFTRETKMEQIEECQRVADFPTIEVTSMGRFVP